MPVEFKTYLATYDVDGNVESMLLLPSPEQEKKRTLIVRETNEQRARKVALELFSLAK